LDSKNDFGGTLASNRLLGILPKKFKRWSKGELAKGKEYNQSQTGILRTLTPEREGDPGHK